jgi:hypothetical protein
MVVPLTEYHFVVVFLFFYILFLFFLFFFNFKFFLLPFFFLSAFFIVVFFFNYIHIQLKSQNIQILNNEHLISSFYGCATYRVSFCCNLVLFFLIF